MIVNCTVTGGRFSIAGFSTCTISAPHPIFSQSVSCLHRLAGTGEIDSLESKLLFMAYLLASKRVTVESKVNPALFDDSAMTLDFPRLMQMIEAIARRPGLAAKLPEFKLTAASISNIPTWLRRCRDIVDFGQAFDLMDSAEDREYTRALVTRRKLRNDKFKILAADAVHNLRMNCPGFGESSARIVSTYFTDGRVNTTVQGLQALKHQILDYLPESNDLEYWNKQAILEKINHDLARSIEISHAMGDISNAEAQELAKDLIGTYTIITKDCGEKVISNEITKTLSNILGAEPKPVAPTMQKVGGKDNALTALLRAKGLLPK